MAEEIRNLTEKLDVVTRRYIDESDRVKRVTAELNEIKVEYLELLRDRYVKTKKEEAELRLVMFLDISGFSKFSPENKSEVVQTLRGIAPSLLGDRGAQELNMWGDAIIANFSDVNEGVLASIKFLRHLAVEGLMARIGMAWGPVNIKFNPATERLDLHGEVVDFAARLEPMADLGTILCGPEFGGLEIAPDVASLKRVQREIQKGFGKHKAGDMLDLYQIVYRRNETGSI